MHSIVLYYIHITIDKQYNTIENDAIQQNKIQFRVLDKYEHEGHLRTRGKCSKYEPQASVFYISRVFSNDRSVLSQCNTRLRLLHLLYDVDFTPAKQ